MHTRLFTIIALIIVAMLAMTAFAQTDDSTPTTAQLQLTATQLIADATDTAIAESGQPDTSETPDPFLQTATALILQATQTGEASGATRAPVTDTVGDSFMLTSTALIVNATQTGEASGSSPVPVTQEIDAFEAQATQLIIQATQTAEAGGPIIVDTGTQVENPLSLTLIVLGVVILVLIALGGLYIVLDNRKDQQTK